MTTLPTPELDLEVIREFGPFRAYASDIRVDSGPAVAATARRLQPCAIRSAGEVRHHPPSAM